MSELWYKEQGVPGKTQEASLGTGTNIQIYVSLLRLLQNNIITVKLHEHKPWYKTLYSRFYVAVGKKVKVLFTSKSIKKLQLSFSF